MMTSKELDDMTPAQMRERIKLLTNTVDEVNICLCLNGVPRSTPNSTLCDRIGFLRDSEYKRCTMSAREEIAKVTEERDQYRYTVRSIGDILDTIAPQPANVLMTIKERIAALHGIGFNQGAKSSNVAISAGFTKLQEQIDDANSELDKHIKKSVGEPTLALRIKALVDKLQFSWQAQPSTPRTRDEIHEAMRKAYITFAEAQTVTRDDSRVKLHRDQPVPQSVKDHPAFDAPKPEPEQIDHPAYYGGEDNPYEAIKVIEAWNLGFCLGNTLKYIARAGKKGAAAECLKKAAWYLNREIEHHKG